MMLSQLLASVASGEATYALRRARLAAVIYGLAAVLATCGVGFLIGAGYICAAATYGSFNAALGFGLGFIVLALVLLLIFKITGRRRQRRRRAMLQSDMTALAAASGVALASNLMRSKAGIGVLAMPLVGYLAYRIIKENSGSSDDSEEF